MMTCGECGRERRSVAPGRSEWFYSLPLATNGRRTRHVCHECFERIVGRPPMTLVALNEARGRAVANGKAK